MPGVAPHMLPVPADAEVIGYGARVNRVNGEIHPLDVNAADQQRAVSTVGYASGYLGYFPLADDTESYDANSAVVALGARELVACAQ